MVIVILIILAYVCVVIEPKFVLQPEMHGNVDPAVLASLPPSMQLDLLVQVIF